MVATIHPRVLAEGSSTTAVIGTGIRLTRIMDCQVASDSTLAVLVLPYWALADKNS